MIRRAALVVMAVAALAGCARIAGGPLDQRTTQGPTARQFWILRMMASSTTEPSLDARRHFEDQLDIRIQQYLMYHPDAANSLNVSAFRFDRQVVVGMEKEQVLILLGPPEAVTSDPGDMEKLARRYWSDMKGNVTEAWAYPLGWRFFFTGPKLTDITQYLERD